VQSDAAIGVGFTSLFAIGVMFISVYGANVHLDIENSLMGEIAFVPWNTVTVLGVDIGPKAFWMLASVMVLNVV
ncbi:iron ABC transporter, partial [Bacillus subtilis]